MPAPKLPPALLDVVLCVALGAAITLAISVATEPSSRHPDALGYGMGAAMALLVLARRRAPLIVLLATAVLLFTYYSLNYPGIDPALPLSVALATAAATRPLAGSLGVAGFFTAAELGVRLHTSLNWRVANEVLHDLALLLAVILLGLTIRNRTQRLAEAERERELITNQRVTEERLRIAQDVHDIVGHSVAAMTVQAGLAEDVLDRDPAKARDALHAIRTAGREAMAELRTAIGQARSGNLPSLDQLDTLVTTARSAGLDVDHSTTGTPRQVPPMIGAAAYRIVQESLTNVLKHAGATRVQLTVHYGPETLAVTVLDDGRPTEDTKGTGHGLTGMAERTAAAGGRLEAGREPGCGFRVHAEFPLRENT